MERNKRNNKNQSLRDLAKEVIIPKGNGTEASRKRIV